MLGKRHGSYLDFWFDLYFIYLFGYYYPIVLLSLVACLLAFAATAAAAAAGTKLDYAVHLPESTS